MEQLRWELVARPGSMQSLKAGRADDRAECDGQNLGVRGLQGPLSPGEVGLPVTAKVGIIGPAAHDHRVGDDMG